MAFVGLVFAIIALCVDSHQYTKRVENHLQQAAVEFPDFVSVSLQQAVDNIVQMHLDKGNCGVFDKESDTNLSLWFQGIKTAKLSIDSLIKESQSDTVLVSVFIAQQKVGRLVSNIRSILQRVGITKDEVRSPRFISLYPYQGLIMLGGFICLITFLVTGFLCFVTVHYY
jgi:hypothetical protein